MAVVMFEQTFTERISGEQILAKDTQNRWCFTAHRIRPTWHLVSLDGLRVCCALDAPDAESVRLANGKAGAAAPERVWSATVHGPVSNVQELSRRVGGTARALVAVERSFTGPVRFDEVQALEDRGAWCLSLNRVEFLVSYFALDGRRMICLYDAPDAETVSRTNGRLGLPFERVWSGALYVCGEPVGGAPAG
ncbi:MAG TPA: nickel-binding protein [Azospirillum sp.]|nr:nickel-binding protein [Azospirillum sp.]